MTGSGKKLPSLSIDVTPAAESGRRNIMSEWVKSCGFCCTEPRLTGSDITRHPVGFSMTSHSNNCGLCHGAGAQSCTGLQLQPSIPVILVASDCSTRKLPFMVIIGTQLMIHSKMTQLLVRPKTFPHDQHIIRPPPKRFYTPKYSCFSGDPHFPRAISRST